MNSMTHVAAPKLDVVALELVQALAHALAQDAHGHAPQEALYTTSRALCSHLLDGYRPAAPEALPPRVALSPWQERLAKQTMLDHMAQGLSIAEVASRCSLSRSHFSRAFKKATGLSPRDWFLQARLDKAQRLLAESGASLSQISLDCGFADQSHFTRVFTRSLGTTPFTWRRAAAARRA